MSILSSFILVFYLTSANLGKSSIWIKDHNDGDATVWWNTVIVFILLLKLNWFKYNYCSVYSISVLCMSPDVWMFKRYIVNMFIIPIPCICFYLIIDDSHLFLNIFQCSISFYLNKRYRQMLRVLLSECIILLIKSLQSQKRNVISSAALNYFLFESITLVNKATWFLSPPFYIRLFHFIHWYQLS